VYPPSLLWFLSLNSISNGLFGMKSLCIQNIYKEVFKVEPADLQKYQSIIMLPILFRVFFGIFVDAKVIAKRKHIVIVIYFLCSIPLLLISMGITYTPKLMCMSLFIFTTCQNLLEGVVSSFTVE